MNLLAKIKIFSKQKAQTQTKSKQSLSSSLVYAGKGEAVSLADFKIFKIIFKDVRYSLK